MSFWSGCQLAKITSHVLPRRLFLLIGHFSKIKMSIFTCLMFFFNRVYKSFNQNLLKSFKMYLQCMSRSTHSSPYFSGPSIHIQNVTNFMKLLLKKRNQCIGLSKFEVISLSCFVPNYHVVENKFNLNFCCLRSINHLLN